MIRVENLSKKYSDLEVLKGVDLEIKSAEILSIVGPSGAGKSTLLHLLGTLDKPTSGKIFYENKEVSSFTDKELAQLRNSEIGFVFQFHNLMAELTAFENVLLPNWIQHNNQDKKLIERADELFDLLNISHRKKHFPSEMSGGEQQRVAVARALINSPKVIFADEPSGNLDSKNADELHQLFFNLREQFGCSIVIVTHNDDFANQADRKLTMQDGRFVE